MQDSRRRLLICALGAISSLPGALTVAGATISVEISDLAATPLERHEAIGRLHNAGGAAVTVDLVLTIKPPVEVQRTVRQAVRVPAGDFKDCRLPYEIFEPGRHKVTCLAEVNGTEASLLSDSKEYHGCKFLYLGHAPSSIADKNYTPAAQKTFDEAMEWLGKELGIK